MFISFIVIFINRLCARQFISVINKLGFVIQESRYGMSKKSCPAFEVYSQ